MSSTYLMMCIKLNINLNLWSFTSSFQQIVKPFPSNLCVQIPMNWWSIKNVMKIRRFILLSPTSWKFTDQRNILNWINLYSVTDQIFITLINHNDFADNELAKSEITTKHKRIENEATFWFKFSVSLKWYKRTLAGWMHHIAMQLGMSNRRWGEKKLRPWKKQTYFISVLWR